MPLKGRDMIDASDPRVTLIGHPAPAWMVNYADLMTELVCFFVVLYAMAAALNKNIISAKKDVESAMKQSNITGGVTVSKEGMQITIEEKGETVLFRSGAADLSPKLKEILSKIGPSLKTLSSDHEIIVEGHTDDLPIHSAQFPSNWDLSTARATSVVKYMINEMSFKPQRLAAIGYGEFHPLTSNATEEGRATNRRVVFFVKNTPLPIKGENATKKVTPEGESATTSESAPTTAPPSAEETAAPAAGPETSVPAETTDTPTDSATPN